MWCADGDPLAECQEVGSRPRIERRIEHQQTQRSGASGDRSASDACVQSELRPGGRVEWERIVEPEQRGATERVTESAETGQTVCEFA